MQTEVMPWPLRLTSVTVTVVSCSPQPVSVSAQSSANASASSAFFRYFISVFPLSSVVATVLWPTLIIRGTQQGRQLTKG